MAPDDARLAAAFEDCLRRMETGASLNDCLLAYPEIADDLRGMLQAVSLLKERPRSRPTVTQIERMQEDYLRRAQSRKHGTSFPKGYAVMAVAALLLVLVVLIALRRPQEDAVSPIMRASSSATVTFTATQTPTLTPTATTTPTLTPATTATPTLTPTTTTTPTLTPTRTATPGVTQAAVAPATGGNVSVTVPLWAGQTINAGSVVISNDEENLYVTYRTSPEWLLQQTHVDIRNTVPINSENLAPGQFAYKTDPHTPPVSEFTYTIPLDGLNGQIVILSHASLIGVGNRQGEAETAWGGDMPGSARRWYFFAEYTIQK